MIGIDFQLRSQTTDVFGDSRFVLPFAGGLPDVLEQLFARENLTG
jgi:hypothetical protein